MCGVHGGDRRKVGADELSLTVTSEELPQHAVTEKARTQKVKPLVGLVNYLARVSPLCARSFLSKNLKI